MISLIDDAQSWGILISASEVIIVLLGLLLLIAGPKSKALKHFLFLCSSQVFFGLLGSYLFYYFNNSNVLAPLKLGFYAFIPPLLIFITGMLIAKSDVLRNY